MDNDLSSSKSFTTSAEIKLDHSMKLFLKGKREYDKGDVDEAINSFKNAVDNLGSLNMGIDESTFYTYLGLSYQKKGWDSYAKAQFQKALSINPSDSLALESLKDKSNNKQSKQPVQQNTQKESGLVKKFKSFFSK